MAQQDRIKFNRLDEEDPDCLVSNHHVNVCLYCESNLILLILIILCFHLQLKLCVTLLVAATLEVDNGVENLWKRGDTDGWKTHANFGQFIPKNYFKAFLSGFPWLWADKEKHWYTNPKHMPWEQILPFVDEYNEKRNNLLRVLFLVLDESMSGFRPKTTKTGGLPNITHEPRKPVSLGTMLRNGAEGKTGILAFDDVVQDCRILPTRGARSTWLEARKKQSLTCQRMGLYFLMLPSA